MFDVTFSLNIHSTIDYYSLLFNVSDYISHSKTLCFLNFTAADDDNVAFSSRCLFFDQLNGIDMILTEEHRALQQQQKKKRKTVNLIYLNGINVDNVFLLYMMLVNKLYRYFEQPQISMSTDGFQRPCGMSRYEQIKEKSISISSAYKACLATTTTKSALFLLILICYIIS